MSLLLLFAGNSTEPRRVLDDPRAHEALADLRDEEIDELYGQAKALLAPIPFGLSDEEFVRHLIDQWGSGCIAETVSHLAEAVSNDDVSRLVEELNRVGRDAATADAPHLKSTEGDGVRNAKVWVVGGLFCVAMLIVGGSATAAAVGNSKVMGVLASVALAMQLMMSYVDDNT